MMIIITSGSRILVARIIQFEVESNCETFLQMSIISISIRAAPLSSLNVKYFAAPVTPQYDHHNTKYDDDNDNAGDNRYVMITIDAFCHIVAKESVAILALEQALCPVAGLEEFHNAMQ